MDLEGQLLRLLGLRVALGDASAIGLARQEVLAPSGRVDFLVGPLVDADPAWLFAHAEVIVRDHPEAALAGLVRTGFSAGDLAERVARIADTPAPREQLSRRVGGTLLPGPTGRRRDDAP